MVDSVEAQARGWRSCSLYPKTSGVEHRHRFRQREGAAMVCRAGQLKRDLAKGGRRVGQRRDELRFTLWVKGPEGVQSYSAPQVVAERMRADAIVGAISEYSLQRITERLTIDAVLGLSGDFSVFASAGEGSAGEPSCGWCGLRKLGRCPCSSLTGLTQVLEKCIVPGLKIRRFELTVAGQGELWDRIMDAAEKETFRTPVRYIEVLSALYLYFRLFTGPQSVRSIIGENSPVDVTERPDIGPMLSASSTLGGDPTEDFMFEFKDPENRRGLVEVNFHGPRLVNGRIQLLFSGVLAERGANTFVRRVLHPFMIGLIGGGNIRFDTLSKRFHCEDAAGLAVVYSKGVGTPSVSTWLTDASCISYRGLPKARLVGRQRSAAAQLGSQQAA